MDVESLAKQLILKGMTEEQQKAVLASIRESLQKTRQLQKQKVGENAQLVIQALKKIESDIRDRYDELGNKIEARVGSIKDGKDGKDGKNGANGRDGRDGSIGPMGPRGKDGLNGRDGKDGIDGVSVTDAHIDFDGSLIISLSNGRTINVGEVVAPDLSEKIKIIANGGGTSQVVLDTLASLQTQINNLIPSQTGQSGKFLTTNGTDLAWAAVPGALYYKGTWNASTNTPTLASGVGFAGDYYVVATAGSTDLDGITDWLIGDWLLFNGTVWQKIDQTNIVTSVNGQTGAVSLTTTNINEGTNLYYTDTRARAALSAGTGISYSTSTGVITNSAPDQTVALTASTGISTTGTYPNFTITNTAPDQTVALSSGTGISTSGTYPNFTITNTAPDQTVALTAGTGISTTGTYPNFTITNSDRGSSQNIFKNVAVSGQSTVVADTNDDTLTFASGTGITITTNDGTDTVTITNSAPDQTVSLTGAGTTSISGTYPNFTITSNDQYQGTVTSVAVSVPTGLSVSGSPITSSGTIAIALTAGYSIPTTTSQTNWDTAYTDRLKWDGGATGLNATTGRTSLGLGTIATQDANNVSISGGSITGITDLAVADGGTGASTAQNARINLLPSYTSNANKVLAVNGTATDVEWIAAGSGTVTSVAQTFTGGLISVSGSPITTSGTLALTVAGTSGGIPYFSSGTTWASSSALASNALMVGGGAGAAPSTITTGTGVVTALGINTGSSGAFVVNGGALGTPSSGTVTNLTGTASININGTVGATTPNTGAFTTLTATNFNAASTFGFKNRIINGGMVIDQRNDGASVTPTTSNNVYPVDRFLTYASQASKYTAQRNAGSVTPPTGFGNYLGFTSSSAYSVTSSDFFLFSQKIEGFNSVDFAWGTASAVTVTLSFWVRSSLTGTFGGSIRNNANNRFYPFSYTISLANTWEKKSVTIAGDTTGTWVGATNGVGLEILWSLGAGSTVSGTAGSWGSTTYYGVTGGVSVVGTNGATFYITGVQLETGSTATSFDYRPYGTELALCQRYYEKGFIQNYIAVTGVGQVTATAAFKINKRAAPTVSTPSTTPFAHTAGDISVSEFVANCLGSNAYVNTSWTASAEP